MPTTMHDTTAQDIESLSLACLDVKPVDRDWTENYGDGWEYIEAPTCPACGDYARWVDTEALLTLAGIDPESEAADTIAERVPDWEAWRCADPACEQFGEEIDPHDVGADGPMMNYAYPLPDFDKMSETDADALRDLPLCIVRYEDSDRPDELALTGGGMDLTWEIAEAFIRLGYLPPAHYAEPPAMSGRGPSNYSEEARARDAHIIAACRRTADELARISSRRAASIRRTLDHIEGLTYVDTRSVILSPDAHRVLCGLVQPNDEIDSEDVTAPEETWVELRNQFPARSYTPTEEV